MKLAFIVSIDWKKLQPSMQGESYAHLLLWSQRSQVKVGKTNYWFFYWTLSLVKSETKHLFDITLVWFPDQAFSWRKNQIATYCCSNQRNERLPEITSYSSHILPVFLKYWIQWFNSAVPAVAPKECRVCTNVIVLLLQLLQLLINLPMEKASIKGTALKVARSCHSL